MESWVTTKHAKGAKMETEIVFKKESYAILGACFEVYKEMGCGFLEAVYHYPKIEHERFVNQSVSRLSRVS